MSLFLSHFDSNTEYSIKKTGDLLYSPQQKQTDKSKRKIKNMQQFLTNVNVSQHHFNDSNVKDTRKQFAFEKHHVYESQETTTNASLHFNENRQKQQQKSSNKNILRSTYNASSASSNFNNCYCITITGYRF